MKYWSPDLRVTGLGAFFAIRGYVTSVATISLDLGIPVDSRQPKQMIRLCQKEEPKSLLSENERRKQEEEACYEEGLKLVKAGKFGNKKLDYEDFARYVEGLKTTLLTGIKDKKQLFLVMGHRNPDSDTVVTSVLEAYRLTLLNKDEGFVYVPIIQAKELPAEIRAIFGAELTDCLIYETNINI